MKTAIILASVCAYLLIQDTASAQSNTGYLKAANRYFVSTDYSSAAAYYEKYLHAGKAAPTGSSDPYTITGNTAATGDMVVSRLPAMYQLAESYRLLTDYARATPLYKQIAATDAKAYPLALYYYAAGVRAQADYAEAEYAFTAFLQSYSAKDSWRQAATRELANLAFIRLQLQRADSNLYIITPLAAGKEGASYAPIALPASTLLFTATWPEGSTNHINRLYQAVYSNGKLSQVAPAGLPAPDQHQGAAAVSEDGHTLYFTAWNTRKGKKEAAVYVTRQSSANAWSKAVLLDTLINKPGYNTQQPLLLSGGKYLLYASDRPGGSGGYDIWYAVLDSSGHALSVANLGKTINTAGNEQAPYYYTPAATLVFATDGRTGMGGYDLFYSKGIPGQWSAPVNFGYPVNSVKDDIYFASLGTGEDLLENALLSSDRSAVCCLQLLAVHTITPPAVQLPQQPVATVTVPVAADTLPTPVTPVFTARILENVYYALNSADMEPISYATLDKLVDTLKRYPQLVIEIGGHTDSTGAAAFNSSLSQRRADNVAAYLVQKGIDKNRVTAKGYGAALPVAPNTKPDGTDNPQGREQNRRTELKILKQ